MKTILCPVDFSASSINALKYCISLNQIFKGKIILMHCFETPVLYTDVAPFTMQLDYSYLHDAAQKRLKALAEKYFTGLDSKMKIEMVLQQGLASARIKELAMERKVSMIIMGATGTGAAERALVGSNAIRVMKESPCKVMIIPQRAKFSGIDKMVYATDLSNDNLIKSQDIFPIAKKLNSEILYLYVDKSVLADETELIKKVTHKVRKLISYPKKQGFICSDSSVADGISYFIKKQQVACLVVHHRHRNLFQSLYSKSISRQLSLHISIPIIVLHDNDLDFVS